jgi:hypothetical protein
MKTLTPKQLERKARRERQRENGIRIEAFMALRDAKYAYIAAVKRELTETDSMSDARWIPAQPDAELNAHCEQTWHETIAHIEAAPLEPIEATIKRATGQDVVSISIYDPLINEKLRAIYGTWGVK